MSGERARYALPAICLACALTCAGILLYVSGTLGVLRDGQSESLLLLNRVLKRVTDMTTFSTSWASGGIQHRVDTTCRENERIEDCLQRHEDAVAAMQKLHPPD